MTEHSLQPFTLVAQRRDGSELYSYFYHGVLLSRRRCVVDREKSFSEHEGYCQLSNAGYLTMGVRTLCRLRGSVAVRASRLTRARTALAPQQGQRSC